tara:strand:- start:445 stop:1815 length:1371 start_codon:yes stop_codon:yes gene_type:complete
MRPLNRPMFRNGGPIKEGIMSGMKEPQAINTVGSPLAPQDPGGRQKYAFAILPFLGGLATRMGLSRAASAVAGQGAKKVAQKTLPSTTTPVSGSGGFFKNIFFNQKPAPYSPVRIGQSKGAKELGMQPKVLGKNTKVKDVVPTKDVAQVSELKPYFANDPSIALVRGTYNALTNPQAKGLFAKGARFVLSPTGVVTAGYFAGGKFFDGEGKEIPADQAEDMGLTTGEKIDEKVITGESDQGGRKLTRDEEIEANRKRYYGMMGVDKLQKDAAYNTLIDASNQIREGGNIKDQLKSGNLVSGVINSLSQNLDKSVDLKRQIDAAILKAEITKDVNREKDQLDAQVQRKKLEVYDKQLKGNDLAEIASLYAKDGRSLKGQNLYAEATRQGIDIKGIFDTDKVNDFMEDNTTKTEADYINEEQKRRIKNNEDLLPPGDYVVGGRIVKISSGGLVSEFTF